ALFRLATGGSGGLAGLHDLAKELDADRPEITPPERRMFHPLVGGVGLECLLLDPRLVLRAEGRPVAFGGLFLSFDACLLSCLAAALLLFLPPLLLDQACAPVAFRLRLEALGGRVVLPYGLDQVARGALLDAAVLKACEPVEDLDLRRDLLGG